MCGIIPPNGLERFANACFAAGATAEREAIAAWSEDDLLDEADVADAIRARGEKC